MPTAWRSGADQSEALSATNPGASAAVPATFAEFPRVVRRFFRAGASPRRRDADIAPFEVVAAEWIVEHVGIEVEGHRHLGMAEHGVPDRKAPRAGT